MLELFKDYLLIKFIIEHGIGLFLLFIMLFIGLMLIIVNKVANIFNKGINK